jgi:Mn-containing catalase
MNPQHAIVTGSGAAPRDSNGVPWSGAFIIASGNLLADFYANVNAEAQGRLQVARIYHMTDDPGIKDLLKFLLARDTMHQNQWLAAIEELKADGLETLPVPGDFPNEEQHEQYAYQLWNFSSGRDSRQGGWASGPTPRRPCRVRLCPGGHPHGHGADAPGRRPTPVPAPAHRRGPRPRRPSRTWLRRSHPADRRGATAGEAGRSTEGRA